MLNDRNEIIDNLSNTFFFSESDVLPQAISDTLFDIIPLEDIPFPVRFNHIIKTTKLKTLTELLNCDWKEFLKKPNCGKKSIKDAQQSILEYLSALKEGRKTNKSSAESSVKKTPKKVKDLDKSVYIPFLNRTILDENKTLFRIKNIPLYLIEWPVKLQDFFSAMPDMVTVGDLLNIELQKHRIIDFIDEMTLEETRSALENLITDLDGIEFYLTQKPHILYLIEKFMADIDPRTKNIFMLRWQSFKKTHFKTIAEEFSLTRERVRQIIANYLLKLNKRIKDKDYYFSFFLELVLPTLTPITFNRLTTDFKVKNKYPPNLFLGILSELFPEVPFEGYKQKSAYTDYSDKLSKISLQMERINLEELFNALKLNTAKEKLIILSIIFNTRRYRFIRNNEGEFYFIRASNLREMSKDILEYSDRAMKITEILENIRNVFKKNQNESISSVKVNLKRNCIFYEFDKNLFGLKKHFGYKPEEWPEICNKIKKFIHNKDRQVNASEIFQDIQLNFDKIRSKYELVYIIRSDDEIADLGFFNFRLKTDGKEERLTAADAVWGVFNSEKNPKHFSEIHQKVTEQRFLRIEGMNSLLGKLDFLKNYGGGFFGLICSGDEFNLGNLVLNDSYIENVVTYEIFPDTNTVSIKEFMNLPASLDDQLHETISKSSKLYLHEDPQRRILIVLAKKWSLLKTTKCLLYNLSCSVFWDELIWIITDIGREISPEYRHKICADKNIKVEDGRLTYFAPEIDEDDSDDIADICYENICDSDRPVSVEELCHYLNDNVAEISVPDLTYVLNSDSRFIVIDNKSVMARQ